jgi:UDP:flavonoid glycosyltransferase YjiC (YdhE family)
MSAGIPQVIMPMGFDQIDNAHRVWSLGVGDSVFPKRIEGDRLAM